MTEEQSCQGGWRCLCSPSRLEGSHSRKLAYTRSALLSPPGALGYRVRDHPGYLGRSLAAGVAIKRYELLRLATRELRENFLHIASGAMALDDSGRVLIKRFALEEFSARSRASSACWPTALGEEKPGTVVTLRAGARGNAAGRAPRAILRCRSNRTPSRRTAWRGRSRLE